MVKIIKKEVKLPTWNITCQTALVMITQWQHSAHAQATMPWNLINSTFLACVWIWDRWIANGKIIPL